jgi:hypothetical protein
VTVTVKEQLTEPSELVAVQLTVVVPMAKAVPEGGVQVTVGAGHPVVVGVKVLVAVQTPGSVLVVMLAGQVIVGAVNIAVVTGLLLTVVKFEPNTEAVLATSQSPAGKGLSIVTRKVTVKLSAGGRVTGPRVTFSPDCGERVEEGLTVEWLEEGSEE